MFKPATYLSKIIWASIGENLKSARVGMDYLQNNARIIAKEGILYTLGYTCWLSCISVLPRNEK